ncbi:alkylhydroperoxidase domain protein [Leucobacter denitrificans]|uniref:Alkylhydroperoxidase domain protein n=1 Tax=Leucobacter denitrificans TaxID=683042 RepID=A0A7G9S354_9MICO|nr:alkylhydroperoxidase domain protein [Leucobacter denitrificans]QNN62279.1 alkylhydroperoxidase domain protein [Leucobacter denitrificans]
MTTTASTTIADVLDALTGINSGDPFDVARARRSDARDHAQGSFAALFLPVDASDVSLPERAAVALFVARLHEHAAAVEFYGALLRETGGGQGLEPLIVAEAERAAGQGPYGAFKAENADESVEGPVYRVDSIAAAASLGDRLSAALEHAHLLVLHPRDAAREHLGALLDAGWSSTGIVTLSQLVSFLSFQLRVAHGLSAIREAAGESTVTTEGLAELAARVAEAARERVGNASVTAASESLPDAPRVTEPPRFTQDSLGWKPWLEPLPKAEFTERHHEGLVKPERINMPYFRLLARDPEALRERTLTDLDIFFNTDAGLPRAEREFAAAAASRENGCVYCASVHSRAASEQGLPFDTVQRLLDEGVTVRLDPRLDAIVDATVALTQTPPRFGAEEVAALREVGLDELELLDVVQAGSFFNWANRLMLSIGEPTT